MLLSSISSPDDLKKIPEKQLSQLASEIRARIIDVVGKNGGHLASNLGVVELTIALHRVFDSPRDAIVWDVSHQSYPHKMLTGRYKDFSSIRLKNGISGFTRISESIHDYFDAGHASSSISSALGLLASWKLQGRNDKVVAVIGDGALTGGMAFEGLSHAGQLAENLIVVVNDNQMSISKNVGSLSRHLTRLTMTGGYQGFRRRIDGIVEKIPLVNRYLGKLIFRMKRGIKGIFFANNFFVEMGFEYAGPLNGHNISELEKFFEKAKKIRKPVVIHVMTKKGKGYSPAEMNPSAFHGIGPFNTSEGTVEKYDSMSFTQVFSDKIVSMAEKDSRILAITAAMSKGTGLDAFSRKYPERFFDVGIAEEHAVTFAGGLAAGGSIPFCAIYSTFMQRAIDQILMDVALPKRHVVLCLDRAGAVPSDGETHQGIFDISLMRSIPNLTMMTVASKNDLEACLEWAAWKCSGPVAIRWPKMSCSSEIPGFSSEPEPGRGVHVKCEDYAPSVSLDFEEDAGKAFVKILIVCTGGMYSEVLTAARRLLLGGVRTDVYSLRFIKPFDAEYFYGIAERYDGVVFVEDGVETGGMCQWIESLMKKNPLLMNKRTKVLAFPDRFLPNGNREDILCSAGLGSQQIFESCMEIYTSFDEKK